MTETRLRPIRVLVVDDNRHMRLMLRSLLKPAGISDVVEACDGSEAYKALGETAADLVICDWNMAPLDGIAFTRQVRWAKESPNPYVPIIMLTAHTELGRVVEARDSGVDEFLGKPISPKALYGRLLEVLERPRSFIRAAGYHGPDRRRKQRPFKGPEKRRAGGSTKRNELSRAQIEALLQG